jgi:uncharacterized protein (UPF0333 family)
MTVEIGYLFNGACDSTSQTWFGKLFSNTLYLSLILSIIILLIITFTYPCKKNTPISITFRLFFYIFLIIIGTLSIHKRIIEVKIEEKNKSTISKDLLTGISGSTQDKDINIKLGGTEYIKITPKIKEVIQEESHQQEEIMTNEDSEKVLEEIIKKGGFELDEPANKEQIKVVGASVDEMLSELGA